MNWIIRISGLTAICFSVALCLYFFGASVDLVGRLLPTTNSDGYETTIARYQGAYTSHFPRTIPQSAKSFDFYYEPSVMQGATRLQLRLVLSAEEIAKIRSNLEGKFIAVSLGIRRPDDSENMMPLRVSSDKPTNKRLTNYEIFTIAKSPDEESNHPKLSGIAISDEFSEVLYWYEDW